MKTIKYFLLNHFIVKNNKPRESEMLIHKHFTELEEEKMFLLTNVLVFLENTTECENALPYISKPEDVLKARSNIKSAVNDGTKLLAIKLKACRNLHIYERPKKNSIYSCSYFLKYRPRRCSFNKYGDFQLFIRNKVFYKNKKICSAVQNIILFIKNNPTIGKWPFYKETIQSIALMYG